MVRGWRSVGHWVGFKPSCHLYLLKPDFSRLVNQALAAAIEELVHDYRLLVCQLEQGINSGLSLHQLWFHLQVAFQFFESQN